MMSSVSFAFISITRHWGVCDTVLKEDCSSSKLYLFRFSSVSDAFGYFQDVIFHASTRFTDKPYSNQRIARQYSDSWDSKSQLPCRCEWFQSDM